MADWDPFAVDEPAESEKPAVASNGVATDGLVSLSKDDIDYINDKVMQRMRETTPWKVPLDPKPDLFWHTPASPSLEEWVHTDVQCRVGRGIAMVWFNRAEQNNTLQDTQQYGLNDAFMHLHRRKDIRVAIFTAEGRMYSAGGDPKGWQSQAAALRGEVIEGDGTVGTRNWKLPEQTDKVKETLMGLGARAYNAKVSRFGPVSLGQLSAAKHWHTWYTLPQFTICLVNGSAMGGGVGCVCCCDYVIAVKKAYFVLSEVKIGVIPATISPYVIAKIGTSNAKRFFCAAENLTATRAKEYGIVDEVVDNMKEGHKRIQEIVKMIGESGPNAISSYKNIVCGISGVSLGKALTHYTTRMQSLAADGEEVKQGLAAAASGKKTPWVEQPIGFDEWPMVGVPK